MKLVKKPWGDFKQFTLNEISTVKILTVKPKQKLSLQYHFKREEMWYFLTDGYAEIGNKNKKYKKGDIVKIKKKMKHRLFSKDKTVEVLEVSYGEFDENDIVRLEDNYGRI
ncbi:MAG: phosphomannose isomerase type II C-terminal cupin domain [Candidatus Pacearchaeota archaeon]|jgi:mannose-1-phosphate guanylyltransferase/mannose-6-phosphate isomerase